VVRRLQVAAISATLLVAVAATHVSAVDANWGAGAWGGSGSRCTNAGQPILTAEKSECAPNGANHHVYIDPAIRNDFESALNASLVSDYDFGIPGMNTVRDALLNANTDVHVQTMSIPLESGAEWIHTTCAANATYGGGSGYYRWCQRQLLRFDPTRQAAVNCFNSDRCTNWAACHELGHTLGLQHPGVYSNEEDPNRQTCLEYKKNGYTTDPDNKDKEQLEDCLVNYPDPVTFGRSSACTTYADTEYP
jgi:hypothetical protein